MIPGRITVGAGIEDILQVSSCRYVAQTPRGEFRHTYQSPSGSRALDFIYRVGAITDPRAQATPTLLEEQRLTLEGEGITATIIPAEKSDRYIHDTPALARLYQFVGETGGSAMSKSDLLRAWKERGITTSSIGGVVLFLRAMVGGLSPEGDQGLSTVRLRRAGPGRYSWESFSYPL